VQDWCGDGAGSASLTSGHGGLLRGGGEGHGRQAAQGVREGQVLS